MIPHFLGMVGAFAVASLTWFAFSYGRHLDQRAARLRELEAAEREPRSNVCPCTKCVGYNSLAELENDAREVADQLRRASAIREIEHAPKMPPPYRVRE